MRGLNTGFEIQLLDTHVCAGAATRRDKPESARRRLGRRDEFWQGFYAGLPTCDEYVGLTGYLDRSRLMLGLNVVAADSDNDAQPLFTSYQQLFLGLRRGQLGPVAPPVDPDRFQAALTPIERAELQHTLSSAVLTTNDQSA